MLSYRRFLLDLRYEFITQERRFGVARAEPVGRALEKSTARDRNLKYRQERKKKALNTLGSQCESCGTTDNLEFHHIDPSTKDFNLGNSWTKSWDRILAELEKCYLICYNCHRKEHESSHGTWARYTNHSCRCPECTDAMRQWYRKRKGKKWREKNLKTHDLHIDVGREQSYLKKSKKDAESSSANIAGGPLRLHFPDRTI